MANPISLPIFSCRTRDRWSLNPGAPEQRQAGPYLRVIVEKPMDRFVVANG